MENQEIIIEVEKAKKTKKSIAEEVKSKTSQSPSVKKLDVVTSKLLQSVRERINKKEYGRKVRDSDIIAKALSLLGPAEFKSLQEESLSEADRNRMAHERYQKDNGKISYEEFVGKLIRGEIQLNRS